MGLRDLGGGGGVLVFCDLVGFVDGLDGVGDGASVDSSVGFSLDPFLFLFLLGFLFFFCWDS